MWPFRRAAAAPATHAKSAASYLMGVPAARRLNASLSFDHIAREGYVENCVAFACVNRIAAAISSVEPQLYKRAGKDLDRIEGHKLLDLMESPNPAQSGKEFLQALVSHRLTGGNAFVLGTGIDPRGRGKQDVKELHLLPPGKVTVQAGERLFASRYEYKPGSDTFVYPVDQLTGRSEVLHLRSFNPLDPWLGLSPMLAAAYAIDIHNAGQQWNAKLLQNDARPSGALIVKGSDGQPSTLTDEQFARLKSDIDNQYSGAANAGRPLLLEGGLEWQQLSQTAKDMDYLEAKNSAAADIGMAFGVPPQLLGIPGSQTFANYEQANLSFWTDTVIPLLSVILEGFNRWLAPLYGDDLYLWFDENAIDALEPLRRAKFERMNGAEFLSVNEKRRATNADDTEGGDTVLVPSGMIPLELAGSIDLSEPGSPADEGDEE